jgi:predicted ribosome quality control (RQC) complex YloA/Tae2 family protein
MARIAGVDLPRNKRIEIALTYIYGLGRHASNVVLKHAGISPDKRTDDLDENDVRKIRDAIEANFRVEGDLRRPRLLPRLAPQAQPAGPRPAHPHQRPHPQGSSPHGGEEAGRRDQEVMEL